MTTLPESELIDLEFSYFVDEIQYKPKFIGEPVFGKSVNNFNAPNRVPITPLKCLGHNAIIIVHPNTSTTDGDVFMLGILQNKEYIGQTAMFSKAKGDMLYSQKTSFPTAALYTVTKVGKGLVRVPKAHASKLKRGDDVYLNIGTTNMSLYIGQYIEHNSHGHDYDLITVDFNCSIT